MFDPDVDDASNMMNKILKGPALVPKHGITYNIKYISITSNDLRRATHRLPQHNSAQHGGRKIHTARPQIDEPTVQNLPQLIKGENQSFLHHVYVKTTMQLVMSQDVLVLRVCNDWTRTSCLCCVSKNN